MTELLAPVRDEVSFTAALDAGADAVYLGLGKLNMRINSQGIDPAILERIVTAAHNKGKKVYITLNVIVYDDEMPILTEILTTIKNSHADAVICWDFAVIEKARQLEIPIHISTQASISNSDAGRFYQNLGATRIVPARELSLDQIKQLKQQTNLEIEVFIHGAMCVSVSGRCFMSQFLHNRSANRGDCLQPCRYEYQVTDKDTGKELEVANDYIMSPKDLCTLPVMDKLIASGIDAFKIEGRSRPPEYIRTVVSAYRQAIDAVAAGNFNKELVDQLIGQVKTVYNRGFSTGFLFGKPGPEDFSDRYGNWATRKKVYIGKVLNYYKKTHIAYADVISQPLAVGDKIQIHGPTTGIIDSQIEQLRTDDQGIVPSILKGEVTFPCEKLVRKNDQIFKIIDK